MRPSSPDDEIARLLVRCRDRHGIVAAIAGALAELGANIVSSAQHSTDPEDGNFFLRMEFHLEDLAARQAHVHERIAALSATYEMTWQIARRSDRSPSTVEYHLRKVFRKLGVKSRTQLARRMA